MEALIVVVITAALALLALPTFKNALVQRDLTRTMNNGRELYLAAFRMATDGAAKSDASLAWPGDSSATTLAEFSEQLVAKNYLTVADLQRILSAPAVNCTAGSTGGSPPTLSLTGKSALKVYKVKGADPSSALFSASSNYIYNTALSSTAVPFGDNGFVVVRKSGDADMYGKNQATLSGWGNNAREFRSKIGTLTGVGEGEIPSGDGTTVLTGP